ncbi:hypothetical protein TrVFT333_010794 [Trichoderma virens FT-333]|nr:hypothetical protein TrVFT333_010794 [Trichoderma virens FT-333]
MADEPDHRFWIGLARVVPHFQKSAARKQSCRSASHVSCAAFVRAVIRSSPATWFVQMYIIFDESQARDSCSGDPQMGQALWEFKV